MKKIIKKLLSVFLCLSFFLFVPSTVYGADYNPTQVDVYISYGTRSNPTKIVHKTGTLPCSTSEGTINQIGYLSIKINCNIKCNAGDVVNVSLDNTHKRYGSSFNLANSFIYATDENGEGFYISRDKGTYKPYNFLYEGVSVPRNCTIESISFAFEPQKVQYSDWTLSQSCGIGFTECKVTVESESTGFFNSVKQFFQQLFEKLTGAFENIGNWFSELGNTIKEWFQSLIDNIKTFFSELGENLKEWFNNIGEWFTEIGDKIGNFFTNLWSNITDTVDNIKQSISDWWQSVVDFFRNLFVPEEGYFDRYKNDWETWARAHFALLYDVKDIFDSIFDQFSATGTCDDYITIPEIKLPFFNNPVIVQETKFYILKLINQNSTLSVLLDIFKVLVTGLSFYFIIKYCMATFSKIITGDEDTL